MGAPSIKTPGSILRGLRKWLPPHVKITGAIHQIAPDLPVVDAMSMNEVIAQSVSPQRFARKAEHTRLAIANLTSTVFSWNWRMIPAESIPIKSV